MYRRARKAFEEVEFWPQEKVDEMVAAVGWEWQKSETAKALAKLAVEEGKIGVYEDKVSKITNKVRGTMLDFRGVKTCGLVREDKKKGLKMKRSFSHICFSVWPKPVKKRGGRLLDGRRYWTGILPKRQLYTGGGTGIMEQKHV